VALECQSRLSRKRDLGRQRRGGLVQQRLRTEERPDSELDAPGTKTSVEKTVDRVMARIRLVACQIQGAIDGERQGGIDLNAARGMTLIARVRAPRQVGHILDGDALARRQRDMVARGGA